MSDWLGEALGTQREPYAEKELPDGRLATADPLTFGRARLNVAPKRGVLWYDDGW